MVRRLAMLLGGASMLFGLVLALSPRLFGRLFDIPVEADPRLEAMFRSLGVRDATIGAGLAVAAARGEPYQRWLYARVFADGVDAAGIALAFRMGSRQTRFVVLGLISFSATVFGVILYRLGAGTDWRTNHGMSTGMCTVLDAAKLNEQRGVPQGKIGELGAYRSMVVASQHAGFLTSEQAAVLVRLADALLSQ